MILYHNTTNKAADRIRQEVACVQTQSKMKIDELQRVPDEHVGLEILHAFVLDVLGRETAAARIFQSTSSQSFKTMQVRIAYKCTAGVSKAILYIIACATISVIHACPFPILVTIFLRIFLVIYLSDDISNDMCTRLRVVD